MCRCVRNINSTHNYLYCEYVTGMITYFDLRVDPHQVPVPVLVASTGNLKASAAPYVSFFY